MSWVPGERSERQSTVLSLFTALFAKAPSEFSHRHYNDSKSSSGVSERDKEEEKEENVENYPLCCNFFNGKSFLSKNWAVFPFANGSQNVQVLKKK